MVFLGICDVLNLICFSLGLALCVEGVFVFMLSWLLFVLTLSFGYRFGVDVLIDG